MGCFCLCVLVQAPSLSCKPAVIASTSMLFLSRPSLVFSPKSFLSPRAFSLQALGGQSSLDRSAYKDAVSSLSLSGCSSHASSCQAPCLLQKIQPRRGALFHHSAESAERLCKTASLYFQCKAIACTLPEDSRLLL